MLSEEYTIRAAKPEDHCRTIEVLSDWWGERDLTSMIPKVFLLHFHSTSIIVEQKDQMIDFLIGFGVKYILKKLIRRHTGAYLLSFFDWVARFSAHSSHIFVPI